jgi:hypothetical protein
MLQALLPHLDQVSLARVSLPDSIRKSAPEVGDVVVGTADTLPGVLPSARDIPTEKEEAVGPAEQVRFNWMLVVAIVAAVGAVFIGLSFMSGSSSSDSTTIDPPSEVTKTTTDDEPPPANDARPAAIAAQDAGTSHETGPRLVELELRGLPDGGIVFLDHEKVRGSVIRVEPSEKSRKLRVEVGDRNEEQWITLTESKTLDLTTVFDVEPAKATKSKQNRPGKLPRRRDAGAKGPEKAAVNDPEPTKPPADPELGLDKRWQP